MDGDVDDFAVWNSVLTDAEVKALVSVGNYSALAYDAGKADDLICPPR